MIYKCFLYKEYSLAITCLDNYINNYLLWTFSFLKSCSVCPHMNKIAQILSALQSLPCLFFCQFLSGVIWASVQTGDVLRIELLHAYHLQQNRGG